MKIRILTAFVISTIFTIPVAQASVVVFDTKADAGARSIGERTSFGIADQIFPFSNNRLVGRTAAQPGSFTGVNRSTFEIEISEENIDFDPRKAFLNISGTLSGDAPQSFSVFGYGADGTITSNDYLQTQNQIASLEIGFSSLPSNFFEIQIDVSSFVIGMIQETENPIIGFLFVANDEGTLGNFIDITGTFTDPNLPFGVRSAPTLSIQAEPVPIPAGIWLFMVGFPIIFGTKGRLRKLVHKAQ